MVKTLKEQLSSLGARSNHNPVPTPPGFDDEVSEVKTENISTEPVADVTDNNNVTDRQDPIEQEVENIESEESSTGNLAEMAEKVENLLKESAVLSRSKKTNEVQEKTPEPPKAKPVDNTPKEKKFSIAEMKLENDRTFNPSRMTVMSARNPGLKQFITNTFYRKDKRDDVVMNYTIEGVLERGTAIVAVWEEGGASYGEGYALLIADKDGNKKSPIRVYHDTDIVNGRHALIPVVQGDLITMGANNGTDWFVVLCMIDSFTSSDVKNKINVNVSVIGCLDHRDNEEDPDDEIITYQSAFPEDHEYSQKYTVHLPVLEATQDRTFDMFCCGPKWVKDYTEYNWKSVEPDFGRCINDKQFVKSLQVFDTTNDAYAELEKNIGEKVTKCIKYEESVLVSIIHNIDYDNAGTECIYIYILCTTFNIRTSSSMGNRHFYARVKLLPGQSWTYIIDKDVAYTYEEAYDAMKKMNKNWTGRAFKRMTI